MNTPTAIITILLCLATLFSPREKFLWPLVISACLLPDSQQIIISGLDFSIIRLVFFFGIFRMVIRHEVRSVEWNYFDKLVFAWCLVGTFVYVMQYGNSSAIVRKLGVLSDSLGLYWIFRQGIRNWDDVYGLFKVFAVSALLLALVVMIERVQQQPSVYSIFGYTGTEYHRGRFRCAGPFGSPIMMGCCWATLAPIFFSRMKVLDSSYLYKLSIVAAVILVILSASSTPLLVLAAIMFFWFLYPVRMYGKVFFGGGILVVFMLDVVMKAPVWHLMGRADIFSGSTGWHRFHLFDQFVRNISDWFWLGTTSTAQWGRGLGDITNQFVLEAVRGGFITMALFSLVMYSTVKITGKYSLTMAGMSEGWLSWGICVSILGHFVAFWGVSYFGQILLFLYLIFAIVGFIQEQSQQNSTGLRDVKK